MPFSVMIFTLVYLLVKDNINGVCQARNIIHFCLKWDVHKFANLLHLSSVGFEILLDSW